MFVGPKYNEPSKRSNLEKIVFLCTADTKPFFIFTFQIPCKTVPPLDSSVVQLVERLLPTPEVRGWNPVTSN